MLIGSNLESWERYFAWRHWRSEMVVRTRPYESVCGARQERRWEPDRWAQLCDLSPSGNTCWSAGLRDGKLHRASDHSCGSKRTATTKKESSFHTVFSCIEQLPPGSSIHGILQAGILKWVAMPFSRGSSQPRNWTTVSCIAGGFFTTWVTREAL